MRPSPAASRLLAAALVATLATGCTATSSPITGPAVAQPECASAGACDDGNPCTSDACTDGLCTHAPRPVDSLCSVGGGQVCDGAGACVACNHDAQCAGTSPDDECQHPVCTAAHGCAPAYVDAGVATTTQHAGDCRVRRCDGAGGVVSAIDDTDTPDDGNDCTVDACSSGAPTHTPRPAGTPCGTGTAVCNSTALCGGCDLNSQCTPPATCGGGGSAGVCGCTPLTCAVAGTSCADVPDGCGGTLACGGAKDGSETDVDCGGDGTTCATRCALGRSCLAGSDCASGICVDGVCCDTACTGTCQACSAVKKGQGADGVCGAVTAGMDPDDDCSDAGPFCGLNGACDGAGACQRYPDGTPCGVTSCSNGFEFGGGVCGGTTCYGFTPWPCTPFACGATACKTTCASSADCASGRYCAAGSPSSCLLKLPATFPCAANDACQSGVCSGGRCQ